ncbi:unnamed protein product, partial [Ilex paraguariensis]
AYLGKTSWPELVGVKGETAAATIEKKNPFVTATIVQPSSQNFAAIMLTLLLTRMA